MLKHQLNYKHIFNTLPTIIQNNLVRNNPSITDSFSTAYTNAFTKHSTTAFNLQSQLTKLNQTSKKVSKDKSLIPVAKQLKIDINQLQAEKKQLAQELFELANNLHNDTSPDVPIGNVPIVIKTINPPSKIKSNIPLKTHLEISQELSLLDLDTPGKITGSGFAMLTNTGVLLELALINYAMDKCIRKGFTPILTPDLVRRDILNACGFAPRTSDDNMTYFVGTNEEQEKQLVLTATSEFPLAALHANEIIPTQSPKFTKKYVGFSHCFRAEGNAGSLNRGLFRVHQFSKVEMFGLVDDEGSGSLLDEFLEIQIEMFQELGLRFRVLNMPTEELGASAFKKYDIEAWMPGKNEWGEISSASNCTDYQSRRLNIRHLSLPNPSKFVHTVNGTAMAVPRMIISVLESFQCDGGVVVPEVLRKYFVGFNKDWDGVLRVGKELADYY